VLLILEYGGTTQGEGEEGTESKRYDWAYSYHKIGASVAYGRRV